MKEWTLGERFGANVVWFRRQAGLSQGQFAERIGMSRMTLSRIEHGHRLPYLDTILKLARVWESRTAT
jgi:transcriptional regulator with XRE-family HTH domain